MCVPVNYSAAGGGGAHCQEAMLNLWLAVDVCTDVCPVTDTQVLS